jgi:2-keto-4-pentenoate hydratase/2-oxohepta-3-ene-1,7-dioic acid hydratase in catechol pathway
MLLAPAAPGKIVGLAANYEGATGRHEGEEPLIFLKPSSAIVGPNDEIRCPFADVRVWGESELAVVVGRPLTRASADEARSAILGYTLGNDVTADNVSERDHHLARSKAVDTFCPIGPWIETEFVPGDQMLQGWHNDTLLRQSSLRQRVMKEIEMLVWLSTWLTLEPGDVVLTGAPTRVRERMFLQDGDTYACRLDALGTLKNTFRRVAS